MSVFLMLLFGLVILRIDNVPTEENFPKLDELGPAVTYTGSIHRNSSLYTEMLLQGVPRTVVDRISGTLFKLLHLPQCHPGDEFKLLLSPGDTVLAFEYVTKDFTKYTLEKVGDTYRQRISTIELDKRIEYISTVIETSLWEALADVLQDYEMLTRITDVYAWEIDFFTESRSGDTFRMVYEAFYKDGEFIKYGDILAAEYNLFGTKHRAFLFTDPEGYTGYFDENGYSLQRALLRSPLNYRRISSGFTSRRLHPIFLTYQPHQGIDYAAPLGTPVVAAGDGVVITREWDEGFGRYLEIQHDFGLLTTYGHLHRFADGIIRGARVRQGDVVGYVGQTGTATGPHLDFRVRRGGQWINPLRMTVPAGPPVKAQYIDPFSQTVAEMIQYFNAPIESKFYVLSQ